MRISKNCTYSTSWKREYIFLKTFVLCICEILSNHECIIMYCIKTKYSQYRLTFNTPGTAFTVNIFQYISLELKFCILFMLECPVSLNLLGFFNINSIRLIPKFYNLRTEQINSKNCRLDLPPDTSWILCIVGPYTGSFRRHRNTLYTG